MGVQEDVKAGLCELAEAHGADLLLIGHAHSSRLRKTFTTSTASHLAHHAPCPTLIIPYKYLGLEPAQSEVPSNCNDNQLSWRLSLSVALLMPVATPIFGETGAQ